MYEIERSIGMSKALRISNIVQSHTSCNLKGPGGLPVSYLRKMQVANKIPPKPFGAKLVELVELVNWGVAM